MKLSLDIFYFNVSEYIYRSTWMEDFFKCETYYFHYAVSVYHSNEFSKANMLYALYGRSLTNAQLLFTHILYILWVQIIFCADIWSVVY
jgi:hypothetical protein